MFQCTFPFQFIAIIRLCNRNSVSIHGFVFASLFCLYDSSLMGVRPRHAWHTPNIVVANISTKQRFYASFTVIIITVVILLVEAIRIYLGRKGEPHGWIINFDAKRLNVGVNNWSLCLFFYFLCRMPKWTWYVNIIMQS